MNEYKLVSSVDIFPTILDYVGIKPPENLPGFSLKPIIEGDVGAGSQPAPTSQRTQLIGEITQHRSENDVMGRMTEGYYLRTIDWHFMWYVTDNKMALYDMKKDPMSDHNVIDRHPDLVEKFKREIETWKRETIASQM
jgi:arylsulfatase A-like enzyme